MRRLAERTTQEETRAGTKKSKAVMEERVMEERDSKSE